MGPLGQSLVVHLRHDDDAHAEDQGQEQALRPLAGKLAGGAAAQGEGDANSGYHKQQGHAPLVEKLHGQLQGGAGGVAHEVELPTHEHQTGMVKDEQREGEYPQPVEVVAAGGGGGEGSGWAHGR